jgi:hypothetical protein
MSYSSSRSLRERPRPEAVLPDERISLPEDELLFPPRPELLLRVELLLLLRPLVFPPIRFPELPLVFAILLKIKIYI